MASDQITSLSRRKSIMLAPPPGTKPAFTRREREILQLIWAGFTNKKIGQQLTISIETVKAHRVNMMRKLRVSNTAQLLKTAIQDGTITPVFLSLLA